MEQERTPRLSRRRLLALAGASGAGLVAVGVARSDPAPSGAAGPGTTVPGRATVETAGALPSGTRRWSDPATWGGSVPGPGDIATVTGPVHLDVDVEIAGVVIGSDAVLSFDPGSSRTMRSTGNVEVRGRLELRPSTPSVVHRLIFTGIDESAFQGGGVEVLASDVGLWVMGDGVLDVAGSAKQAWTTAAGSVEEGSTTVTLAESPTGWQVGDEIALTPTERPGPQRAHWSSYDLVTVAGIDGRLVTLSGPTAFAHPEVTLAGGDTRRAEVLNLSRNAVIEGEETGRAHLFFRSSVPQSLSYLGLRHLGPRRVVKGGDEFVPGRYGIHLHQVADASRGSEFVGVVGRQIGSHTFVTHLSHGVTWRDCITHDTQEDAYWWDPEDPATGKSEPSNDVVYERCVASLLNSGETGKFRLSGFFLGAGENNVARECVTVGVGGRSDASGYIWPNESEGMWTFEDCVAHNNKVNGIFVWQNTELPHIITRFTGFHNGAFGISHGAYKNAYLYQDAVLHANGEGALRLKAVSRTTAGRLQFLRCDSDGGGLSDFAVVVDGHTQPPDLPTDFIDCAWRGATVAAFGFVGQGENPHLYDVVDNRFEGNEFWLAAAIPADSLIRVQDQERGSISLERSDQPGTVNRDWNAAVNPIAPFAR